MQSIGGQTHVVLPYNEEQFIREKVASAGADWEDRCRKVREAGHELIVCSDQKMKFGNIGNEYAWDVMRGLARIHAGQLETERVSIGKPSPSSGIIPPRVLGFCVERRAIISPLRFTSALFSKSEYPRSFHTGYTRD